jgi:hypothetical protein
MMLLFVQRKNRFRDIQYIEGQEIFAVQYTSIHKAAIDGANFSFFSSHLLSFIHSYPLVSIYMRPPGSSDAVKFFLSGRGRTKGSVSSKVSCDDWDKSQMSAIHHAAERGFDHVIEMLVTKGSDVNVRNGNGNTSMMLAAKSGFPGTIEVLFRLNADLLAKNAGGQTAAHFAIQADHVRATLLSCILTSQSDILHS